MKCQFCSDTILLLSPRAVRWIKIFLAFKWRGRFLLCDLASGTRSALVPLGIQIAYEDHKTNCGAME